jgi:dihydrofolate reductase
MSRIMMFNRVSMDGYFADANGGLDWVVPEPELDAQAASGLGDTGTILFGRKTYDGFESFWPKAVDDSPTSPAPHGEARRSTDLRAMGMWINNATKIVFSKTRKDVTWKGSKLVRELDPKMIAELKNQPGKDMIMFGSGSIASQLTEHGLIDDYWLVVSPVILGAGKSLFTNGTKHLKLALVESKSYPNGNVSLQYRKG